MEERMKNHGVPDWWLESCRKIQYLFLKAHAASYVKMSLRMAWYKIHYPLAFYTALFIKLSRGRDLTEDMLQFTLEEIEGLVTDDDSGRNLALKLLYEFYRCGFEIDDTISATEEAGFPLSDKSFPEVQS